MDEWAEPKSLANLTIGSKWCQGSMIIYEVNLSIEKAIFLNFKTWLLSHVQEMLLLNGFLEVKVLQEKNPSDLNLEKLVCWYLVESEAHLDAYFTNYATNMRQEGLNKFGKQFTVTRRVLACIN